LHDTGGKAGAGGWGILVGLVQSATLGQRFSKFLFFAHYSSLLGKC